MNKYVTVGELKTQILEIIKEEYELMDEQLTPYKEFNNSVAAIIHYFLINKGLAYHDPETFEIVFTKNIYQSQAIKVFENNPRKPYSEAYELRLVEFKEKHLSENLADELMEEINSFCHWFVDCDLRPVTERLQELFQQSGVGIDDLDAFIERGKLAELIYLQTIKYSPTNYLV